MTGRLLRQIILLQRNQTGRIRAEVAAVFALPVFDCAVFGTGRRLFIDVNPLMSRCRNGQIGRKEQLLALCICIAFAADRA